jgi:hypothetical protein
VTLAEQELIILMEDLSSSPVLVDSCLFCAVFVDHCWSFWPLYSLSFFDFRFLITASNFSSCQHKTQDENKQSKKHTTISVGHHHTQDTRRRQTKQNTTQYMLDTTIHKTQDEDQKNKTQHNICWTPPYTKHKTKTNKTKNTTQYVLDITIHKTQDEDQQS